MERLLSGVNPRHGKEWLLAGFFCSMAHQKYARWVRPGKTKKRRTPWKGIGIPETYESFINKRVLYIVVLTKCQKEHSASEAKKMKTNNKEKTEKTCYTTVKVATTAHCNEFETYNLCMTESDMNLFIQLIENNKE